jgi:hypothetical protein
VLSPHDTFQFHADEPSTSSAVTQVDTLTPQIPVVTATVPVSANGTVVSPASAFGQSPQMLWMNLFG